MFNITPALNIKKNIGILFTTGAVLLGSTAAASSKPLERTPAEDTFTSSSVTPKGTSADNILFQAPDPQVVIDGELKTAVIVVDLSQNILYKYDEDGNAEKAYLVASGKKSTPTSTGIRSVTHIETYPYRYAPTKSKRRRNPGAYGPKIICLETINPKTGERGVTGEFIHGNSDSATLGQYVSHGCIRMDNDVIKELAAEVKRGDIVVITK